MSLCNWLNKKNTLPHILWNQSSDYSYFTSLRYTLTCVSGQGGKCTVPERVISVTSGSQGSFLYIGLSIKSTFWLTGTSYTLDNWMKRSFGGIAKGKHSLAGSWAPFWENGGKCWSQRMLLAGKTHTFGTSADPLHTGCCFCGRWQLYIVYSRHRGCVVSLICYHKSCLKGFCWIIQWQFGICRFLEVTVLYKSQGSLHV